MIGCFIQVGYSRVNDFERNSINNHSVSSSVNLGQIRSVQIGHDSSLFGSGWYLDKIIVYDLSVQSGAKQVPCHNMSTNVYHILSIVDRYTLECNCWLDSSKGSTWATLTVKSIADDSNTNHLCQTFSVTQLCILLYDM